MNPGDLGKRGPAKGSLRRGRGTPFCIPGLRHCSDCPVSRLGLGCGVCLLQGLSDPAPPALAFLEALPVLLGLL